MDSKPASFRVLLSVIILIVVVVLAVAYLPFLSGVRSWWGIVTAPSEVRSVAYIGSEDGVGVAYTAGFLGLSKHSFEGYSVVDYATSGKLAVAILENNGAYDLYDVSEAAPVKLSNDGKEKGSMDLSEDGMTIAYAQKDRDLPLPVGATEADNIYNLGEWSVYVYDIAIGKGHLVGPGNHPRFYAEGLFYPTPYGFMYRVPGDDGYNETDQGGVIEDSTAFRVLGASVSPDGRYAFYNPLLPAYDVLRIESIEPLSIVAAPENPLPVSSGVRDIVLGKNANFVLMSGAQGTGVSRLTKDVPATVFMFPSAFTPEHFSH